MLAGAFSFDVDRAALDSEVRAVASRWWILALLGAVSVVVGVLLLANLTTAVATLALLVAIGLIADGIAELVNARRFRHPIVAVLLGVVWIATGVLALAWPGVTLWVLAVVTGLGFLIGGIVQAVAAVVDHAEVPLWGVWFVLGLVSAVVGVMALAWPAATILVLAVLLGIRLVTSGIVTLAAAFALKRLA